MIPPRPAGSKKKYGAERGKKFLEVLYDLGYLVLKETVAGSCSKIRIDRQKTYLKKKWDELPENLRVQLEEIGIKKELYDSVNSTK